MDEGKVQLFREAPMGDDHNADHATNYLRNRRPAGWTFC